MIARLRPPSLPSPLEDRYHAFRRWIRQLNPKNRNCSPEAQDNTSIVPMLDAPIVEGESLIWCGAFQLAWNEACDRFQSPIKLEPPSDLADALSLRTFGRESMDEASIFVASGMFEDGIVDRIRKGVRKMSQKESQMLAGLQAARDWLICYARLDKALDFPKPFGRLGYYPLDGTKVPCFGYLADNGNASAQREQTLIHDYRGPDDFVVELKTKEPGDMLILARILPSANLREMTQGVIERLNPEPKSAAGRDVLVAPCVQFSGSASFTELEGRRVVAEMLWILSRAFQSIDFAMNEKGVSLSSTAVISFSRSLPLPSAHIMILKPPFLLLMKRREAREPYFAYWIANTGPLKRG